MTPTAILLLVSLCALFFCVTLPCVIMLWKEERRLEREAFASLRGLRKEIRRMEHR